MPEENTGTLPQACAKACESPKTPSKASDASEWSAVMAEPVFGYKKRAEHFGQRVRTYVTHPEPAKAGLHRC